jgi:DNA polymerase
VFGVGNRNADLMFVGEAPGQAEDEQGIPFVGAAGKLLDRYLFAVDIPRESVYIANILKCRPPHNRDPLPEEEDACIGYLREQVKLIQPKIIVCLGRISAMRLIKPDFRITREHGVFVRKGGCLMTAVYHPAALLRDASKKEEMLLDFEKIKAQLDRLT